MSKDGHPSELALLNRATGQIIEGVLGRHIDGCAVCQARVEALQREGTELAASLRPGQQLERLQARLPRRPRWRLFPVLAGAAAAAVLIATLWLALGRPTGSEEPPDGGVRLKGELQLQVYLQREGQVLPVGADTGFRAGDRVRLGVLSPVDIRVSVLSLGPAGLEPIPELRELPVAAGTERLLPGSLEMECAGQREELLVRVTPPAGIAGDGRDHPLSLRCERP